MKITKKKPLRPRGRGDEKRQYTKDEIREVYANGPQREVQIIPAKKDLATDKEQRKLRVCAYCRVSTEEENQASLVGCSSWCCYTVIWIKHLTIWERLSMRIILGQVGCILSGTMRLFNRIQN